jgi:deoxycytidine triphosphate deaminase
MLSRDEIKRLGIILDDEDRCYRAASYDLRIGRIIAALAGDNASVRDAECHVVRPQGMVEVISWESIKIPPNIAGYASVKTSYREMGSWH